MRSQMVLTGSALIVALAAFPPAPAHAFGDKVHAPDGWGREQVVRHWIYKPDYKHVYASHSGSDKYQWQYRQPGYYPYYGSNYWVPREVMRYRYRYSFTGPKYQYRPSWGRREPTLVDAPEGRVKVITRDSGTAPHVASHAPAPTK